MADKTTFKIFVASSNELKEEREKCILLITQLNKSHKHLHLEPVEWEIDMVHSNFPESENIQDAINPKLKESDLVVFIFYSRIGKYTLEEFEFAKKENKKLFAYFKKGFSPEEEDQLEGYRELIKFKKSLNDTVLYSDYEDLDNFEKLFYPNLNLYLVENHPSEIDKSDRASLTALSQSNQQLIQLLAAKEEEIKTLRENTNQLPDTDLQIQINELLQDKEAIRSELLQSEEVRKQLAKDKVDLENQLAPQIEHDALKAKAFRELENGNYAEAEDYLMQSAKASVEETASTFFELAKIKNLQLLYSEALNYYELAAKLNPGNSLYLNEAGVIANDMGFYNRSIEYQERALKIEKEIHGDDHEDVAVRLNNIGTAYIDKGEYDKGIECFEKALNINKKVFGEEDSSIAINYNNIGSAYRIKGEYDKGIEYLEKSLAIETKNYGENHSSVAITYDNIGLIYISKQEYKKAIAFHKKAIKIDIKSLGEGHPTIATRYNNIGLAYRFMKEYSTAIDYYEKALVIGKKFFGIDHPKIAAFYNNIGTTYNAMGENNKAIEYFEKALAIDKKFHTENHPDIATRYNNIGLAYHYKKEYAKAISFYENSLAILLTLLPENHPNIQITKNNIKIIKNQKKNIIP